MNYDSIYGVFTRYHAYLHMPIYIYLYTYACLKYTSINMPIYIYIYLIYICTCILTGWLKRSVTTQSLTTNFRLPARLVALSNAMVSNNDTKRIIISYYVDVIYFYIFTSYYYSSLAIFPCYLWFLSPLISHYPYYLPHPSLSTAILFIQY